MTNSHLEDKFTDLVLKFYQKALKSHSDRKNLAVRFNSFIDGLDDSFVDRSDVSQTSLYLQPQSKKDIENEFQSVRITKTRSRRNFDASPSRVSHTRSRSHDSSRDRSDPDCKFFSCDWIYSSPSCHKTTLYAIIAAFVLTDNKFYFGVLQNKINDYLDEHSRFSPILMTSISRHWRRIGDLLSKNRNMRWEKGLKEIIDKLPVEFVEVACHQMLGEDFTLENMDRDMVAKLTKEIKANLNTFVINYREIEKTEKIGKFSTELIVGFLKHSQCYVVSNKLPEYSEEEIRNRTVKDRMRVGVTALLKQYTEDTNNLKLEEFTGFPSEKEQTVKDFFSKKKAQLQATE